MSRILVTGGSGFIGTNLVRHLVEKKHIVGNYDIAPPRDSSHDNLWIQGDIRTATSLNDFVKDFDPEIIFHLAARTDLDGKSIADYSSNTDGVINVVNSLQIGRSLRRVLFASSRLVCKIGYSPNSDTDYCPTTFYGESKVRGEQIVRENARNINCDWAIFRPTSIWGEWFGTPYKEFFFSILRSLYIHPKGMRVLKSFGYVGNSVYILDKMMTCDRSQIYRKTFYLADYPPIEVKAWADLIARHNGSAPPLEFPKALLYFMAMVGDCLKYFGWKHPPLTTFRLNNLITEMVYDTSEVEAICGELPFSVSEGVENTLRWIRKVNSNANS